MRGGAPQIVRRSLRTGAEEELSPAGPAAHFPNDLSPDGQWLLFGRRAERGDTDLLALRLRDRQLVPFRTSPANETLARFSPDGKFVAFGTNENGPFQVVIAPFPSGLGTPVSSGGATLPRWSADGRELFYIGADGELMAVRVTLTPSLEIGPPVRLFTARARDGTWRTYEVARDGRFFALVRTQVASEQPLTVLVNWRPSGSSAVGK